MPTPKQLKLQHLLWRAGFGPTTETWQRWQAVEEKDWWLTLQKSSALKPDKFDIADDAVHGLTMGVGEFIKVEQAKGDEMSKEEKKQLRQENRALLQSLNLIWLDEMVVTRSQVREKLAFFWHGHFASRNLNTLFQQDLLHVIREHALGNFRDLLRGVSKSAAMLAFLNNQQNKKASPNENFAREVMELFTMGRGHYTETDIKEAARAFTGWSFGLNGDFTFRKKQHDTGTKTVLGKTGNFTGDDVLDILLEQRQTARFIARKLYRFLVNEEIVPDDRVRQLGDLFFDSGYDIMALLNAVFTSPWFYETENIGGKIKSPVELWVGIRRTLPLQLDDPEAQLLLQRALGQVLFHPPNVAGWPGGRTWIDSTSLMLRLRLPHIIAANGALDIGSRSDDDVAMGQNRGGRLQARLALDVDWKPLLGIFGGTPDTEILPALARFLWQTPNANPPASVLKNHTDTGTREQLVKTTALQLMATPEYQLC
ncbi:MAG: DUF1800 domain-containing protein [Saprospiraceae bacterium]